MHVGISLIQGSAGRCYCPVVVNLDTPSYHLHIPRAPSSDDQKHAESLRYLTIDHCVTIVGIVIGIIDTIINYRPSLEIYVFPS